MELGSVMKKLFDIVQQLALSCETGWNFITSPLADVMQIEVPVDAPFVLEWSIDFWNNSVNTILGDTSIIGCLTWTTLIVISVLAFAKKFLPVV